MDKLTDRRVINTRLIARIDNRSLKERFTTILFRSITLSAVFVFAGCTVSEQQIPVVDVYADRIYADRNDASVDRRTSVRDSQSVSRQEESGDLSWVMETTPIPKPSAISSEVVRDRSVNNDQEGYRTTQRAARSNAVKREPVVETYSPANSEPTVVDLLVEEITNSNSQRSNKQDLSVNSLTNSSGKEVINAKSVNTSSYLIRPGDTLFSIAWRFNIDRTYLAEINGIRPPFVIYPGETIQLPSANGVDLAKMNGDASRNSSTRKVDVRAAKEKRRDHLAEVEKLQWVWPLDGKVVKPFRPHLSKEANSRSRADSEASSAVNKGLDIAAVSDGIVVAAADGKVVYSGQGLVGYGKLIIIKHGNDLLSAYGHNKTLFVSEGDRVKAGDKIAEVGTNGDSKEVLHFEIRQGGLPVDPLLYLPRASSSNGRAIEKPDSGPLRFTCWPSNCSFVV